jgi:Glycosyl transferase 4-like domain
MGDGSEGNGVGAEPAAVRVAFVSQFVYPHDEEVRIRRLSASFSSHGWRCAVFSRGQSGIPYEDACGSVPVRRWRAASLGPFGGIVAASLPWNPLWVAWLSRQFRDFGADVVIVRNLRLALQGVLAARVAGLPVVLDQSENFPALVKAIGRQKLSHVLNHPRIVRQLEAVCLWGASGLVETFGCG